LILKLIIKYYFNIFLNKKYFKKQMMDTIFFKELRARLCRAERIKFDVETEVKTHQVS